MRVKRSVHARKKRRATLARTKGYRGQAHSSYKRAKEALLKPTLPYRDGATTSALRRLGSRAQRRPPAEGLSYSPFCTACARRASSSPKVPAHIAAREPGRSTFLPSKPGRRRIAKQTAARPLPGDSGGALFVCMIPPRTKTNSDASQAPRAVGRDKIGLFAARGRTRRGRRRGRMGARFSPVCGRDVDRSCSIE